MLLFNELSLHGQFSSAQELDQAITRLLSLRKTATEGGFEIRTAHGVPDRLALADKTLRESLGAISMPIRSAFVRWLSSTGPFWEDEERHPGDVWLQSADELVTDTGLGEAAYRVLRGTLAATVSTTPSQWDVSSIPIRYVEAETSHEFEVDNLIAESPLTSWIARNERPMSAWSDLRAWCERRCKRVVLAAEALAPLAATPFISASAERIQELIEVLNTLAVETTKDGLTAKGHGVYQAHYARKNAHFSDSSDAEKNEFRNELTFTDPREPGKTVFATWHGKIRTGVLRLHYIHEFSPDGPVHVVYVGPKLTKR